MGGMGDREASKSCLPLLFENDESSLVRLDSYSADELMLKGLLCLDSKLDRVVMLLVGEEGRWLYKRGGSISFVPP